MKRWDVGLPLRAFGQLGPALGAVLAGSRLGAGSGPADAIIVLGAMVLPGGVASGSLRCRAEAAAALYHLGVAPVVITTGASHSQPPGEAVVARALLIAAGVPAEAILIEEKSRNTKGNLLFARGLSPAPRDRVYLVTEPFHLARSLHLARQQGFDPMPWPVDSPAWRRASSRWRLLLRDAASLAFTLAGS